MNNSILILLGFSASPFEFFAFWSKVHIYWTILWSSACLAFEFTTGLSLRERPPGLSISVGIRGVEAEYLFDWHSCSNARKDGVWKKIWMIELIKQFNSLVWFFKVNSFCSLICAFIFLRLCFKRISSAIYLSFWLHPPPYILMSTPAYLFRFYAPFFSQVWHIFKMTTTSTKITIESRTTSTINPSTPVSSGHTCGALKLDSLPHSATSFFYYWMIRVFP